MLFSEGDNLTGLPGRDGSSVYLLPGDAGD